jgi:hypothetical protein
LDLPAGSAEALAASVRGSFGNSIAWRCLRHGIGPGHPDWPELSRAIVAFGGSIKGFRAGAPARGLLWWENPGVIPGMVSTPAATPAAAAMAVLLARQATEAAPTPAPTIIACPAAIVRSAAEPALPPVYLRQVLARTATGPPTGPPVFLRQVVARTATGPPTAPPAIRAHQFSYDCTNGARAWLAPPYRFVPPAGSRWQSLARRTVPPLQLIPAF